MPDETTILSLPLILPAQAQKHVTHNEALAVLDLIVQLSVINRTLTTAPALPAVGDRHIVAAGATGPWAGQSGKIALFAETGWQFTAPLLGWQAHVLAEGQTAVFDGAAWKVPSEAPFVASRVGVSATPDATNRLAVSSPATLLNHAGAGHQLKLNKATAGDTASLLFQTGFSGRAEMGTAGTDDFSVKVSADGSAFNTALVADAATGRVTLPQPVQLGGQAADPAAPGDGTLWLNTTTGEVKVRSAGGTVVLGGGGVADGDKGDVTVSGSGAVWTIDAGAVSLGKLADVPTDVFLGRDTAGSGAPEVLTPAAARTILNVADGATANATDASLRDRTTHTGTQLAATISDFAAAVAATAAVTANTAKVTNATHTGDVTGATALTIANDAVTNAKLANMATASFKGRVTAGTGDPEDLTVAQVKAALGYTAADVGAAATVHSHTAAQVTDFAAAADARIGAASINALADVTITAPVTGQVLKWNGTAWINDTDATGGGGVTDGDKGDITVSGTGAVWTIDADAVSYAKLQNVSAASRLLGRGDGGAGDVQEITLGSGLTMTGTTLSAAAGGGTGDVVGPAAATNLALARFDGVTGKLIRNSVNLVSDAGEVTFPAVASPATPAAGSANLFARNVGGRIMPAFIGPSGLDSSLQPHIGRNKVGRWNSPGTSAAAVAGDGLIMSTSGTLTASNWAGGTFWGQVRKSEFLVTTASATAVAGMRSQANQFTVGGTAANRGGFHLVAVWGPATGVANATHRAFVGMRPTGVPTDVEASVLTDMVGMGWDAADANVQFLHNDSAGVATKIDLGAAFPVPAVDRTTIYRITMFSPPGTTQSVSYQIENLDTAASATGTVTTNLPGTAAPIAPTVQMSVGGTSTVVGVAVSQIYIETDN